MGLLEQFSQIAGSLMGGDPQQQQQQSPLLKMVLQMLSQQQGSGGGLNGLMQAFQKNGMGEIFSSWVGTGQNQPISPEQMQTGLGPELVQRIAQQTGMNPADASAQLSNVLPDVVDKLTPEGQVPDQDFLDQALSTLKGRLQ